MTISFGRRLEKAVRDLPHAPQIVQQICLQKIPKQGSTGEYLQVSFGPGTIFQDAVLAVQTGSWKSQLPS